MAELCCSTDFVAIFPANVSHQVTRGELNIVDRERRDYDIGIPFLYVIGNIGSRDTDAAVT